MGKHSPTNARNGWQVHAGFHSSLPTRAPRSRRGRRGEPYGRIRNREDRRSPLLRRFDREPV